MKAPFYAWGTSSVPLPGTTKCSFGCTRQRSAEHPLEKIAEAFVYVATGNKIGNVIITLDC